MQLTDFHNYHKGETALMVGNGNNLHKTPPHWFHYPSFGLNTIFYYEGWKPTYYVAVDAVMEERYGEQVKEAYPDVPKFIPSELSTWQGDGFVYFKPFRQGISVPGVPITNRDAPNKGIGFTNSMTAAMQIAVYMGFSTMLMIGVEQKPGDLITHFWGADPQMPKSQTDEHWNIGYLDVQRSNPHLRVLNISADTFVPENVLPRDDWKNWKNT
jgi:hypothetical protein